VAKTRTKKTESGVLTSLIIFMTVGVLLIVFRDGIGMLIGGVILTIMGIGSCLVGLFTDERIKRAFTMDLNAIPEKKESSIKILEDNYTFSDDKK